ncbi:MAG TPA: c-type cytochrome [Chthoniobacterales bacterium]
MTPRLLIFAVGAAAMVLAGCGKFPGQPDEHHHKYVRPEEVSDFKKLYAGNCAGCHSLEAGKIAAARSLNDPAFAKFVGKENIEKLIAGGVKNTAMPALGAKYGGYLTDAQIAILADGILETAGIESDKVATSADLPPYSGPVGNAEAGKAAFAANCVSCHGPEGTGNREKKIGSIVDPNFLALTSDQSLRSLIIVGRSDLKHPDRTQLVSGKTLSDADVADIVGYLASLRPSRETGVVGVPPIAAAVPHPSPTPGS